MAIDETSHHPEDEILATMPAAAPKKHDATTEELEAAYVVDVNEASQALGVSLARLSQLTTKGTLSHVRKRVGARWRIYYRRAEIDELARLHRATHYPRTTHPFPSQASPQGNMGGRPGASGQTLAPHDALEEDDERDSSLAGHGRGEARWLYRSAEGRPWTAHLPRFLVPVPEPASVLHRRHAIGYGRNQLQSATSIAEESASKRREEDGIRQRETLILRSNVLEARLEGLEEGLHALRTRGSAEWPVSGSTAWRSVWVPSLPSEGTATYLAERDLLLNHVSSLPSQEARLERLEASLAALHALLKQFGAETESSSGTDDGTGPIQTVRRARKAHSPRPSPRMRYVK